MGKKGMAANTIAIIIVILVVFVAVYIFFFSSGAQGTKALGEAQSAVTDFLPSFEKEDYYTMTVLGPTDPRVTLYVYVFANQTPQTGFTSNNFVIKDNNVTVPKTVFESYNTQHIIFLVDTSEGAPVADYKQQIQNFIGNITPGFYPHISIIDFKGKKVEFVNWNQAIESVNVNITNYTRDPQAVLGSINFIRQPAAGDQSYLLDAFNLALGKVIYLSGEKVPGQIDGKAIILMTNSFTSDSTLSNRTELINSVKSMVNSTQDMYIYAYAPNCDNNYPSIALNEADFTGDLTFLNNIRRSYCYNDMQGLESRLFTNFGKIRITYAPIGQEGATHTIEVSLNPGGTYTGHETITNKVYPRQ